MAHKQYVNIAKDYEVHKDTPLKSINHQNKDILKKIIGKDIELKSSYSIQKRKYYVDDVLDMYQESSAGKLIPAFKLFNKKLSDNQQIIINTPTSLIQEKTENGMNKLILNYEHNINIEKGFKHLHKQTQEPLKIYIYYN
jgi:hypothetical protein